MAMNIDTGGALRTLQGMANGFIQLLPSLALALIVFFLFTLAGKGVRSLVRALNQRYGRHGNVGLVLGRLAQGGMVLVGLLVALVIAIPSFQPGQLVSLLGISSVAIGFAFRDILQNFLAGILLLLTEPFRVGDQIIVGNYEGTVEEIQTRATLLKTYDGRRVVIPNADLFTDSVTVNTAFEARRLEFEAGIGYGDDIERARAVVLEAVRGMEGVLADPAPDVLVVKLGDFSVNLRVRWWITPPRRADALEAQSRVLTAVKNALTAAGIDLPFPTQQILFHDQTEETDGDRRRQREGWPAGTGKVPKPRPLAGMAAPTRPEVGQTAEYRREETAPRRRDGSTPADGR
jgi:small-conductance mechanosensitive channel